MRLRYPHHTDPGLKLSILSLQQTGLQSLYNKTKENDIKKS
jgi:hypothetical protein